MTGSKLLIVFAILCPSVFADSACTAGSPSCVEDEVSLLQHEKTLAQGRMDLDLNMSRTGTVYIMRSLKDPTSNTAAVAMMKKNLAKYGIKKVFFTNEGSGQKT